MRTIVKGKNMDVRPEDRRYAQAKMRRLERLLDERSDAILEFSLERHRSVDDSRIVEATLVVDGRPLRGVAHAATHRAALDVLLDKLERRTVALKERPRVRTRPSRTAPAAPSPELSTEPAEEERPEIVKIKRFGIEPMFAEDAVAQMEELGHQFFVFVNAENERLAVLYRRRDGDYGVIEPALGGEYSENGRTPRRARTPGGRSARAPRKAGATG